MHLFWLMNDSLPLFNLEIVRSIILLVFLAIVLLSFLKYVFFSNEVDNKGVQKVIGGICVFIVAILSSHPAVFFASLFIGGLIIASEDFLKTLAAIWRTRNDKVSDTLRELNYTRATPQEIEEKQKQEVVNVAKSQPEEEISTQHDEKGSVHEEKKSILEQIRKIEQVEGLVANFFREKFGDSFQEHVRITSYSGEKFIADGIVKENEEIKAIVETRNLSRVSPSNRYFVAKDVAKIRMLFPAQWIIYTLVIPQETLELRRELESLMNYLLRFEKVWIHLLRLDNGKIVSIRDKWSENFFSK